MTQDKHFFIASFGLLHIWMLQRVLYLYELGNITIPTARSVTAISSTVSFILHLVIIGVLFFNLTLLGQYIIKSDATLSFSQKSNLLQRTLLGLIILLFLSATSN